MGASAPKAMWTDPLDDIFEPFPTDRRHDKQI